MESILTSDIFFFITSIAVIIMTLTVVVMLFYGIKIVRHIAHITQHIQDESDMIAHDIKELRSTLKKGGSGAMTALSSIIGFLIKHVGSSIFGKNNTPKQRTSYRQKKTGSRAHKADGRTTSSTSSEEI